VEFKRIFKSGRKRKWRRGASKWNRRCRRSGKRWKRRCRRRYRRDSSE
jgi:hypothetical protein